MLGMEKPGSRAFHTPLPGTCFSWFLQDSSPFRSGFNLTFCSLSLHTIHFPTACVTTGDYRSLFLHHFGSVSTRLQAPRGQGPRLLHSNVSPLRTRVPGVQDALDYLQNE